jgi:NADH dehydrogenase [ubiquinone] 1 alpha subcomplex assembly factor 7
MAPDGGALALVLEPAASPAAALIPNRLTSAPDGSVAEIRPAAITLATEVARRLVADGGAALFVDYGHAVSTCGDTLQAVRQHRYHSVLEAPGSADLTAHVDFQAFADVAWAVGVRVCGPVTQGEFLRSLGIEVRERQLLANATRETSATIASGVHRLIDDREMGTLFKVLALTHPDLATPAGFPAPAP